MDPVEVLLRRSLEATRLGPRATEQDAVEAAENARSYGLRGVCVEMRHLAAAADVLGGATERPRLVSVANFPNGCADVPGLQEEIRALAGAGVDEIDVVAPLHALATGRAYVTGDLVSLCRSTLDARHEWRGVRLKVILECAAFPDVVVRRAARAALRAGADWLKTSTGFHPAGGASARHVQLLLASSRGRASIKASGGVRTRSAALEMLTAGAHAIGTSAERAILEGDTEILAHAISGVEVSA